MQLFLLPYAPYRYYLLHLLLLPCNGKPFLFPPVWNRSLKLLLSAILTSYPIYNSNRYNFFHGLCNAILCGKLQEHWTCFLRTIVHLQIFYIRRLHDMLHVHRKYYSIAWKHLLFHYRYILYLPCLLNKYNNIFLHCCSNNDKNRNY